MTMRYKGYVGAVEVDTEADLLHGEVAGIRDVVTFQGRTPAEANRAFRESVDDYLEFCARRGERPDKPFSGRILVRIDATVHRQISTIAEAAGISLNSWISEHLRGGVLQELSASIPRRARRPGVGDDVKSAGSRRMGRNATRSERPAKRKRG